VRCDVIWQVSQASGVDRCRSRDTVTTVTVDGHLWHVCEACRAGEWPLAFTVAQLRRQAGLG
jgi:hypothetical protein